MKKALFVIAAICACMMAVSVNAQEWKSGIQWKEPPVVDPGPETAPANVPSDAIVLFNGKDMSAWNNGENWKIEDGVVYSGRGMVSTKQVFGSIQLHVEFATPSEVKGEGQGRGNSGVFYGPYEVQVLAMHCSIATSPIWLPAIRDCLSVLYSQHVCFTH